MYVSSVNSDVSFNSVYKVPYTSEGAKNLKSALNETYKQALDEMQRNADNKEWVTIFNKRLWKEPAPIPIGTDLLAISTMPLCIIKGGNPYNPILVLDELKPCTGHIISDIEFTLRSVNDGKSMTNITQSEANIIDINYYRDYSLYKHSDKLLEHRVEVLKNMGINLPILPYQKTKEAQRPQKYLYVLSQGDCIDYCKYKRQDRLNDLIDKVKQENLTRNTHVKLRNFIDRLGIKSSFEKDSTNPSWEKTVINLLAKYNKESKKFNSFLSKREIKEVSSVDEAIDLLKRE